MWISVKDRLPEEGLPVWTCKPYQEPIMLCYAWQGIDEGWLWERVYSYWKDKDFKWQCESELDDEYEPEFWMPLPEPLPQGKSI